jgi:hypothetical protein
MGASLSVEVEGLRELVRDLERAGVEVDDLKDALGRIAAVGADTAQGYTPRKSGKLAGSVRGNRAKNRAQVLIGTARVRYAGPILFGWPRRGIRAARTIARTDQTMADRAPLILDDELSRIFTKYGFQ